MNLDTALFNNTIGNYLLAISLFTSLLIGFKTFQKIVIHRLALLSKKSSTDFDDFLIEIIQSINPLFYLYLSLYGAIQILSFVNINLLLKSGLIIFTVFEVGSKIQNIIDYIATKSLKDKKNKAPIGIIKKIIVGLIWSLGGLLILSNLGIDISSLIAGLGIGGIAIALAIQNILGDLFSSFAIYFDKPFEVGDFIIVGEQKGTVEKIGIKTTRIRALQGEEIVIANNDLTNARIHNYKKMKLRRANFSLGVTYNTSSKKLAKIPQLITKIINSNKLAKLDRVHFSSFEDSSLNFDIVYYVQSADYSDYMDIQQEINLKIVDKFEQEKIEFAFPSQTVYLAK
jgi:small-conductance mechanosensitive channel